MRVSQFLLTTSKETPADAEIVSHQLMLRAAMIRRLGSGLYTWLPLGLRVLRKIENIVREEMNKAGALEILMPAVQPAELWQETQRWDDFGPLLLKMTDQNKREYCFGPTHEEVVTDLARRELHSYKQLPITFYQVQMKFRDEIRPRFGVMRAREFLMKDAYSFDLDQASLQSSYDKMYTAYSNIFTRCGLDFRPVLADSGSIGGSMSQEFHVLAETGEDAIYYSDKSDYAANIEQAEAIAPSEPRPTPGATMQAIDTPNSKSIEAVCDYLKIDAKQTLKTLIVEGVDDQPVALLLRGDHQLNELKAEKHPLVAVPFSLVDDATINKIAQCDPGYVGPVNLDIPVIADRSTINMADFVCGANRNEQHLQNVNWGRDLPEPEFYDLRNVQEGDPSPDGQGTLKMCRGIEVGHIFQLGDKYSSAMQLNVLNDQGKSVTPQMGCYGIGVSRIVAAAIEQNHDENGIIWPTAIAPFHLAIVPINMAKSQRLRDAVEATYKKLEAAGFDVLLDDRNERPGAMFADMDLIGIPHRLVLSDRGLDAGTIEYKGRRESDSQAIPVGDLLSFLQSKININNNL